MTRTPAEILADPDAHPADKVVARAYIRRLTITVDQATEGLALAEAAGLEPDDASTVVDVFLTRISPYGRWRTDGGPYPVPEETFTGWHHHADNIRAATEGLTPHGTWLTLHATFDTNAARLARILLDRL